MSFSGAAHRARCDAAFLGPAAGWSLVEFMVAIAVASLVAMIANAMILAVKSAYVAHVETAQLEENGRYALEAIGRNLRQAAFENWGRDQAALVNLAELSPAVMGLDAKSLKENEPGIDSPVAKSVNGSDVLALRFIGDATAAAEGSMFNCAGLSVAEPADLEADRGWSIFYVASDKAGEPELRCKYRGKNAWNSEAIARGVESFQVLYGIDTDADGIANRFLNAAGIDGLDATLALEGNNAFERAIDRNRKTFWKKVVSVRLALLVRSAQRTDGGAVAVRHDLFGARYADAYGGADAGTRIEEQALPAAVRARARKIFTTTVQLRNQDAGIDE